MSDYNLFLKEKCCELIKTNVVDANGNYIENIIREYLIFSNANVFGEPLNSFFLKNTQNRTLLNMLLKILLDESEDYSNDARYNAAYFIAQFDEVLLKEHTIEIKYAQNYEIENLRPFRDNLPNWL